MKNKYNIIVCIGFAVVSAVLIVFMNMRKSENIENKVKPQAMQTTNVCKRVRGKYPQGTVYGKHVREHERKIDSGEASVPSIKKPVSDDGLSDSIQNAFDENDLNELAKLSVQALYAKSEEVREEVIDALAWFDRPALEHIIPFLGDPSKEVRQKALDEVLTIISDEDDDATRASEIAIIMKSNAITDEDMMDDVVTNLDMISDNSIIVKTIVDVMENGQSELGKKFAGNSYSFMTGEDYTNAEAALKWVAENCEDE